MRLSLNRWIALATIAATVWMVGCSADSPTPTSGGGGGGNGGLALQITTTNASPKAGACTIVQAFATLNGSAVPDGTSVVLSTSFGVFAQNGLQSISLVTQSGAVAATVCSDSAGAVTVTGTVTLAGKRGQKTLILQFTPNGLPNGPFISVCSTPHSGPVTGGTNVTITGQGFGSNAANVRVFFRSGAVIHQAVVTSVTNTQITAITPAFPELAGVGSASVDVEVVISGGIDLVSPNCFTFNGAFISICANPGSGPVTGGTAVTIQGGGFGTDPGSVQVLFRIGSTTLPGTVTSVTDTAISVTTPAFTGLDATKPNVADVIVKVGGATTITSAGCFTFTAVNLQPVVSSILPSSGTKLGGTRATILGSGFSSPVQVFFGGVQAEIVSVSFSQIIVITPPLPNGTPVGLTGAIEPVVVKNADCGSGTSCQSNGATTFTYTVPLSIVTFSPIQGDASTVVTILGQGFVAPVQVLFGNLEATVVSVTGTQILVKPPAGCGSGGTITVTNIATGESATSSSSFTGVVPTITQPNGLVPNSGPANSPTAAVVNGSHLFESSNPQLSIFNAQGGTVTITGTSELNGGQFVNVSITPNGSAATVTFAIRNDTTGCVSGTVSFAVTNAPQITVALNPNTGPIGSCTTSTVSGTGLFPTGVPAGAQIVNVTGPGTVTIVTATDGNPQVLTLSICPTAAGTITFQIQNTGTGLISSALSFTASCGATASAPNPATGPSGQPNTVSVTGSGLFPTGNPGAATIVNVVGGTVIISGATDGATQTLTLTITPTVASCSSTLVTFAIKNTVSNCTTGTLSFTGTAGITASAPNPGSGPAGTLTVATVTGSGFFPTGDSSQAVITGVSGGTVTISGASQSGNQQTLTLQITPAAGCAGGSVTFSIKNNATGCVSAQISFTSTGTQPAVTAGPTPGNGPATSTTQVTVTGTNLFPAGNPAAASIVSPVGGTVTIVSAVQNGDGTQTLTLNITPTNCSVTKVTFAISNGSCTTPTLNFIVNSLVVTSGPTPSSGPASGPSTVTVVGTGFFPSGNPAAATATSVVGGTVTITNAQDNTPSAGQQTLTLSITPTNCSTTSVTFKITNSVGGCSSNTLSFIANGLTVITGPTPSNGPPTSTTTLTIVGRGFFQSGNPSSATIVSPTGGNVAIISAQDNTPVSGEQTLTINVQPTDCTITTMNFMIKNTVTSCTSQLISFIVNSLHVISGPTPSSIPTGAQGTAANDVTFTGTGFFPLGDPSQLEVINVAPVSATAAISSTVDNPVSGGTQTATVTVYAKACGTPVTFNFRNKATGCTSQQISVLADLPAKPVASFTQSPGGTGSGVIVFTSTATPAGTDKSCTWTFTGTPNPPVPTTFSTVNCGQTGSTISVTFPGDTGGSATLVVTDDCGQTDTKAQGVIPP